MKKVLLAASIASALSLANVAQADTGGTITFDGKIIDQTCQVTVGNSTDGNGSVMLATVSASDLFTPGSTAKKTEVVFKLTGCNAITTPGPFSVQPYFEPALVDIDVANHLLINQEPSTTAATKVGLELLFPDSTVIPIGDAIGSYGTGHWISGGAGDTTATATYYVRYKSVLGGATAGKVLSYVTYSLAYQ